MLLFLLHSFLEKSPLNVLKQAKLRELWLFLKKRDDRQRPSVVSVSKKLYAKATMP